MDRRAKKLEKKRKDRAVVKQRAQSKLQRRAAVDRELVRTAASAPFGPCWISEGWDDLRTPAIVSVMVTRQLSEHRFLPVLVLVDRTCLGVKDASNYGLRTASELAEVVDVLRDRHIGMHRCELLVAQSVVFHAIDYARRLGFEPADDFPAELFGARPDQLLDTPWHSPEKPYYIQGPYDDVQDVLQKLRAHAGQGGFDYMLEASTLDAQPGDEDYDVIDTQGETVGTGA